MLTILNVLERTTEFFREKGLPEPKLDAEYLISHALGMKRLDLFLQFERPLPEADLEKIREGVRRRTRREPLQHILGTVPFCGLVLKSDRRALIPRPETEFLVEKIREEFADPPATLLDLGTGSGAIALALAVLFPEATVIATDAAPGALELARENLSQYPEGERIDLRQGIWLEGLPETFDLIVSNPPYLTEQEWEEAEPEVRDYEPRDALIAGKDGLADLEMILRQAYPQLNEGGQVALETGINHHEPLTRLARECGYTSARGELDLQRRPRYFFARK